MDQWIGWLVYCDVFGCEPCVYVCVSFFLPKSISLNSPPPPPPPPPPHAVLPHCARKGLGGYVVLYCTMMCRLCCVVLCVAVVLLVPPSVV